jgi:hypothetical protein
MSDELDDDCRCGSDDCSVCVSCTLGGGEGWEGWGDCDDPLRCCSEHEYDRCPCRACGGTGLRSMQRVF